MVANIELKKITRLYCTASSLRKSVENAHALIAHTNQIKIAMSSDEPRPAKIYLIQLCAQQRHKPSALMRIEIRIFVVRCSDNLFIGFCMPNSTVRRAAETKQAVVVLPRHNNNS